MFDDPAEELKGVEPTAIPFVIPAGRARQVKRPPIHREPSVRSWLDRLRAERDARRARCTNPRRTRRVFEELAKLRASRTADRDQRQALAVSRNLLKFNQAQEPT